MQHFQCGAQLFDSTGKGTIQYASRFHAQNGPQALATGEDAVTHGAMNGNWILCCRRQQALKRRVGQLSACLQGVFEHDGEYSKRAFGFAQGGCCVKIKRTPNRASHLLTVYFYAAADCVMAPFPSAARKIPRVSDGGQTSAAPAFRAAAHKSSSAKRWVQTIRALGKSRDRCSISEMEAASISRMAIPATCFSMLFRSSPNVLTWRTDVEELARAETRHSATLESLWRSTTLRGCILTSLGFYR